MNQGCIALHPLSRDEGMRRDAGMGLNARASVDEVNSVRTPDRSLQNSPVSFKLPGSPRQVTDGSDTSCYTNTTTMLPVTSAKERNKLTSGFAPDQPSRPLKRSGPVEEDSEPQQPSHSATQESQEGPNSAQSSSNCMSGAGNNPSLPQHEQIEEVEPLDISYCCTAGTLRIKALLLERLSHAAPSGRLQVVDVSKRGLDSGDAEVIKRALRGNPQLAVLKLGFNNLGDEGASIIASAISQDGNYHHRCLTVLDVGFNSIGDQGCTALALHALAGNHILRTLILSGNNICQKGAMSLAGAILHGCSLNSLHVASNKFGPVGVKVLAGAVAQSELRREQLMQRQGGVRTAVQPVALEELNLGDLSWKAQGFVALPSMLLSNISLKSLCLSNNDIDDRDMALFAQAVSQNKRIPLVSLQLSFNKITCVGVECLMNAIWGSQTLREVKLDNNKIQDRGAQLCSVVLGSVKLEVLDLGFNRVSTVGIKAIMKSLSENDTLRSLSMSGIPMDQNSSKAVSYAMAYNTSLEVFNIDSCCVGYSGQRHIVAGVVSNRNVKLRTLTGFPLGPITKTLGVPQLPEDWGNDRVLSFMRYMWGHWSEQNHTENGRTSNGNSARGPAPPATVAAAAKKAFAALVEKDESKQRFEQEHRQAEASPLLPPDAAILERAACGTLQVPSWNQSLIPAPESEVSAGEAWSESDSFDRSSFSDSSQSSSQNSTSPPAIDPERRNKNLQWLRAHSQSLAEVGNLAFSNADLWQLHQYFFSPVYSASDEIDSSAKAQTEAASHFDDKSTSNHEDETQSKEAQKHESSSTKAETTQAPPPTPAVDAANRSNLGRAISFQTLQEAVSAAAVGVNASSGPNKRRSLEDSEDGTEPCAKRAKSLKPRIDYYPRIRRKLESLGTKPSGQTLSLLRQLKYIEGVMLQGKNIYTEECEGDSKGPTSSDVEMILLDLL